MKILSQMPFVDQVGEPITFLRCAFDGKRIFGLREDGKAISIFTDDQHITATIDLVKKMDAIYWSPEQERLYTMCYREGHFQLFYLAENTLLPFIKIKDNLESSNTILDFAINFKQETIFICTDLAINVYTLDAEKSNRIQTDSPQMIRYNSIIDFGDYFLLTVAESNALVLFICDKSPQLNIVERIIEQSVPNIHQVFFHDGWESKGFWAITQENTGTYLNHMVLDISQKYRKNKGFFFGGYPYYHKQNKNMMKKLPESKNMPQQLSKTNEIVTQKQQSTQTALKHLLEQKSILELEDQGFDQLLEKQILHDMALGSKEGVCHQGCDQACCNKILHSIACVEYAIAGLLNEEGEKLHRALELCHNWEELFSINQSVQKTLRYATRLEQSLVDQLESIINMS